MFYIDKKCKYNILTMNANIVATLLLVSGAKSSRVLSHSGRARVKHCQRTFDFCHQEDDLDDTRNEEDFNGDARHGDDNHQGVDTGIYPDVIIKISA